MQLGEHQVKIKLCQDASIFLFGHAGGRLRLTRPAEAPKVPRD